MYFLFDSNISNVYFMSPIGFGRELRVIVIYRVYFINFQILNLDNPQGT